MKLLVGASAGGHASDMSTLLDSAARLWPDPPQAYVTTAATRAEELRRAGMRVYVIHEADRRAPLLGLRSAWQSLRVVMRERPDAFITTGAMPMAVTCVWARLFGAKVVWIDCVSQTEELSLSARLVKPFVHLMLSQWPDVAGRTKGVEYAGEVL